MKKSLPYAFFLLRLFFLVPLLLRVVPFLNAHPHTNHAPLAYRFTENKGQWPEAVKFRAELPDGRLYLEGNRLTYFFLDIQNSTFPKHHGTASDPRKPAGGVPTNLTLEEGRINAHAYRVHFLESQSKPVLSKELPSPDYSNYFYGGGYSAQEVYAYHKVTYRELYPGVDLVFYNQGSNLKYDFVLQKAKTAQQIKLYYEGAERVFIRQGKLVIQTSINEVIEEIPHAYQKTPKGNKPVRCAFRLLEPNTVGFVLEGAYDPELPLLIDPVLVFSTYTGSFSDNWGYTATYDKAGALYSGGIVHDVGFPISVGALQVGFGGQAQGNYPQSLWYGSDIALIKYNSTGTNRLWATYLGGSFNEQPHSLIVNENNELFMLGATRSSNFPVTQGCYDPSFNGGIDIVVARINATGTILQGSTYLGGNLDDGINRHPSTGNPLYKFYADDARGEIILSPQGEPIIISSAASPNFPVTPGVVQPFLKGQQDAVFLKMTPNLTNLLFSTFLGGDLFDAGYSVRLMNNGEYYVVGGTNSATGFLTTPGTWQPNYQGGACDGFILRINSGATAVLQGSYVGANNYDQVFMLDYDDNNNLYMVGQTESVLFPVFNALYSIPNAGQFVIKMPPNLNNPIFSARFGSGNGQPDITISAFMVDKCQNIYVSGWGGLHNSGSTQGLPVTANAFKSVTDGSDFYLCVFNKDMASLQYATFFGGNVSQEHVDGGTSRFDKNGIVYQSVCAGCGGNNDFPTTPGAWSATNNASNCNNGTFKFEFGTPNAVYADFNSVPPGCAPYSVTFTNTSTGATGYEWNFGAGLPPSNQANPTVIFHTPGVYTVSLKALNPGKCNQEDQIQKTITVKAAPVFTLQPSATNVCIGQTINISYNGPILAGSVYQWNFNGGSPASSTALGPHVVSWNTPGIKTITLSATIDDCSATQTAIVTVFPNPSLPAVAPVSRCGAGSVTFTATSSNPLPEQILLFATLTDNTPIAVASGSPFLLTTPALSNSTTFYIEARIGNCKSSRLEAPAHIHPITPTPIAANISRCGAGLVTITANAVGAQTASLYASSTSTTPLASAAFPPPFSLTLTVNATTTYFLEANNSQNCPSERVPVVAVIHPLPPTPVVQNLSQCGPSVFTFSVSNVYAAGIQLEIFSGGCAGPPLASFTTQPFAFVTGNIATTTVFFFQVKDPATGCNSACANATASVMPLPGAPSAFPPSVCQGQNLTFTVNWGTPPGALIRLFTQENASNPIQTIGNPATPFAVGPLQTTTTFYLEAVAQNCSSARSSVTVEVLPQPEPPSAPSVSRCGPGSVTLSVANGIAAERVDLFLQLIGGNPIASAAQPPFVLTTPLLSNSATFYLEAVSAQGCKSARQAVSVSILPIPSVIPLPSRQICGPGSAEVTVPQTLPSGTQIEFYSAECEGAPLATSTTPASVLNLGALQSSATYYYRIHHLSNGCKSNCASFAYSVLPLPSPPLAEAPAVCLGQISRVFAQMGAVSGSAIAFYTTAAATQPSLTLGAPPYQFSFSHAASGVYTYYLETILGECKSARVSVEHTVHPTPQSPQAPAISRCGAGMLTISVLPGSVSASSIVQLFETQTALHPLQSIDAPPYQWNLNVTTTSTFWLSAMDPITQCSSARVSVVAAILPLPFLPGPFILSRCGPGNVSLTLAQGFPPFTEARIYTQPIGGAAALVREAPNLSFILAWQPANYWLETYNATTGCSAGRAPITLTEHPIPPPPTVPNIERCLAGAVTFSVHSVLPGYKVYLYTSGASNFPIDSTQSGVLARNVTASSTFYWESLDMQTGCRSERSSSLVTVHSRPATPGAPPINVCSGQSFAIEVTTTYPQVVTLEVLDANQSLVAATNQLPYSFPLSPIGASTQFYLRAVDIATGCTSLLGQVPVTLVPNPPAPIAPPLSRCGPGSLTATLQVQSPNAIVYVYQGEAAFGAPIQTISAAPYLFTSSLTETRIFTAVAELQPWGCKSLPTVFELTVFPIPTPPSAPSVARCYSGNVTFTVTPSDLEAEEIRLFAEAGGNTVLQTVNLPNVNLVSPIISTTTSFYIGVRNAQTGCASENVAVTAIIHSTAEPAALALQNCGPASLTFTATQSEAGADRMILWDAQNQPLEVKSFPYVFTLPLVNHSTTFFLQAYNTSTGCSSSLRPLPVTIHPIPAPPSANTPQSCGPTRLTFTLQPSLPAVETIRIYPDMQQPTYMEIAAPFIFTTPFLSQTTTFYASAYNLQTGCQGARVPIVARIAPIPAAPSPLRLFRCGAGSFTFTVQNPNLEPSHIQLYSEDGVALLATAENAPYALTVSLSQNSRYQVAAFNPQTGCRSQAQEVEIVLHPLPGPPLANVQTACGNTSVEINLASGAPSSNEIRILDANQNILRTVWLPAPPIALPYVEGVTYQLIGRNVLTGCLSPPLVVAPQPNPNPPAPSPATLERCGPGNIDWSFTASDNWRYAIYSGPLGGVALYTVAAPAVITLENITQSGVYYIEAIDPISLCRSPRSPLTLRILPLPQSPPPQNVSRCGAGRISISGSFPQNTWSARIYEDAQGMNLLSSFNGGGVWHYQTAHLEASAQFFMAYQDEQTGCRSALVPLRLQILPLPQPPVPDSPFRCGAGNVHFTVAGEQTILLYTENQTLIGSVSQPPYRFITPFINTSTTFYFQAVSPVTQCSSQKVGAAAIVYPIPAAPVVSNIQRCGAGQVSFKYTPQAQEIVSVSLWGAENESVLLQSSGSPFVLSWNVASSSRFWLSVQTEHCQSPKSVFQVTVHPIPAPPLAPPITQCANSGVLPVTLTAVMGQPAGTQINVYTSPAATQAIATQAVAPYHLNLNVSVGVSSTFYLESENSITGCKSARAEATVTLHPNPILPPNLHASRCGEGIVEVNIPFDRVYEYKLYQELPPSSPIASNLGSALQFTTNILTQSQYFYFQLKDISAGCTSPVAPIWVELLPVPSAPIVEFPKSLCAGESLKVSHRLIAGTQYFWEGPNGFTYLGNELFIPYISAAYQGVYTVRAINAAQCSSDVAAYRLRVIETAQIVPEPGYYNVFGEEVPFCVGQEINLFVKNFAEFPEGAQFEWRGPNQFYSFPHPFPGIARPIGLHHAGVYQVRAWLGSCATDWASIDIKIYDKPRVPEIYSNAPVCQNDSALILWAHSPGAVKYYWVGPGAFAAETALNEIRRPALVENSGIYSVVAVNAYGCFSDTATLAVEVTQGFNDLLLEYPTTVCEGQTVVFEIPNPIAGATYSLRGPAGFETITRGSSLLMLPDVGTNAAGVYTLTATVGNCLLPPANFPLRVNPRPATPIIRGDRQVCIGQSVSLSAVARNPEAAIVWEFQQTFFEGNQLLLTPARLEGANEHWVGVYAIERGCTSERVSVELNIHPTPTAPLAASAFEICQRKSLTLELPNLPVSGKYLWAAPGRSYTVMNEPYTFEPEETGVYSIVGVVNGCTSAPALMRITVNPIPSRPIIQANGNLCLGSNLLLRAIGAGEFFVWNGPLLSNRVGQQLSIANLNFLHNGTYSVVAVQRGCTSEPAAFAVAAKQVSIEQVFSNAPICAGQNLLLTAFSNAPQAQYLWQGPSNFRLQTTSPQVVRNQVSLADAGVYSVTVISQGCTSLPATLRVEIQSLPPSPLIKAGEKRCEGDTLSLTLEPEPTGLVQWFFPDGSFYEGVRANYRLHPNSGGNIRAVIRQEGCGVEAVLPIEVNPIPPAPAAPKIGMVCQGDILTLSTEAPSLQQTFYWRGPNDFEATGRAVTFPAAHLGLSGQYTVAAIERGCTSEVAVFSLQVQAPPVLEYLNSNSPLCAGQTLNLQVNPIPNAEYHWRLPNGERVVTASSSLALENVTEEFGGVISVRAIVNNCVSLPVETVVKISPPLESIRAVISGPHCEGETLTLTALGPSFYRYFWSGPNNFIGSGQTVILPGVGTAQSGLYEVWAVAEGCTSNVAKATAAIHALPSTPIVTHNSPLCSGQTLTLSVNLIVGATYLWQGPAAGNPSGFFSAQQNPVRNNMQTSDAGLYSLTVRLGRCTSTTVTFRVEVFAAPRLPVVSNNGPVCEGETLQLQTPWLAGATYLWQGPAGFVSTQNSPSLASVTTLNAGEYSLLVTQNGCVSQPAYTQVSIFASPTAFLADTLQVCSGAAVRLNAPALNNVIYRWIGPGGFSSSEPSPVILNFGLRNQGDYRLFVERNGCRFFVRQTRLQVQNCRQEALAEFLGGIRIYPNPSTGVFTVALSQELREKLRSAELFDPKGRQMERLDISLWKNEGEAQINVNYGAGIYLLLLQLEDKQITYKLMIR